MVNWMELEASYAKKSEIFYNTKPTDRLIPQKENSPKAEVLKVKRM